jgi:aminopeptidase N
MNRNVQAPRLAVLLLGVSLLGVASTTGATKRSRRPSPAQNNASQPERQRPQYQIHLTLDFDNRSYSGSERVRWTNRGDHSTSVIFFHLYSNVRSEQQTSPPPATNTNSAATLDADEPRIEITEVRAANDTALFFTLDDQGVTLRVNLRESVAPEASTEVAIKFKGAVPEIDAEETGLVTHVIKQVSAAIKNERESRRARDVNFRCRGVMLLGTGFPILAVRDGDDWRRKVEPSIGDIIFAEASDYEATIETSRGVAVFTSGTEKPKTSGDETHSFAGTALRDFAIIAGRSLRVEQRTVGDVTVRSIFLPEHEGVGRRVLAIAADAVKIFFEHFGPLPFRTVTVVEAPLVAGLGSTEFAGFDVIASAFYVDFESPAMRNMPEIIREQRGSLEDSLEWTVGHLVAHEWWGAAIGNDPNREPVLDEALAGWSALLYYRQTYGEQRAAAALQDQLRGVYRVYRTLGGEDMAAEHPSRDYRNSFQYAAIVMTKGALMFAELQRLLGDERFFAALRGYYKANLLEIADMDDLRGAFIAEAPIEQRRVVARTFNRWLSSKRGDEDIALPDRQLAASLGLPVKPETQKSGDRNALTVFGRLGKFFWQQMTRIH